MTTNTHGGPRPGSGRPPNETPSQRLVIHATDDEYRAILELTPRQRTEALLGLDDDKRRILELLAASAIQAYRNCLVGNPAPAIVDYHDRVTNPRLGDIVVEITTDWPGSGGVFDRIGTLIERSYDKRDGEVFLIESFNGNRHRWRNARFIAIPESGSRFWCDDDTP